jgi:hypothetical protein
MHAAANWNGSLALISRRHIKPGSMDTALIRSRFSGLAIHSWRSTHAPLMPKALAILQPVDGPAGVLPGDHEPHVPQWLALGEHE